MTERPETENLDAQFAAFLAAPLKAKPAQKVLAVLSPGSTTVYDAAMSLTGRGSRPPHLGINGVYGPSHAQLGEYLRRLDAIPGQEHPAELFDVLNAALADGNLRPINRVYFSGTTILNPFLTLVSLSEVKTIFDARQNPERHAIDVPIVRVRPTESAVRDWQRNRVLNAPDNKPAPTEEADWQAASAQFGDMLRRADYRKIRAKETPPEWRKSGPRRPWGVVKEAIAKAAVSPAKLPRQE